MTKSQPISHSLRAWMDVFMHRSMRGWTHFAKSTGLSMAQFSILMQLHHKGPCGMSEISERFDVSAAAASQLVDKLVQAGYIVYGLPRGKIQVSACLFHHFNCHLYHRLLQKPYHVLILLLLLQEHK